MILQTLNCHANGPCSCWTCAAWLCASSPFLLSSSPSTRLPPRYIIDDEPVFGLGGFASFWCLSSRTRPGREGTWLHRLSFHPQTIDVLPLSTMCTLHGASRACSSGNTAGKHFPGRPAGAFLHCYQLEVKQELINVNYSDFSSKSHRKAFRFCQQRLLCLMFV